jgi:hypothetical protein
LQTAADEETSQSLLICGGHSAKKAEKLAGVFPGQF